MHASFDNYAQQYDDHFTHTVIGQSQRNAVHHYLLKLLNKDKTVLEINCGTGEDALLLAKYSKQVVCTDASQEMITICKRKLQAATNCITEVCTIQQLNKKFTQQFDLIVSNFGGLNCINEQELKSFVTTCNQLLHNNGELFFVIMGRKCWWEKLYFNFKKDKAQANRRKNKNGVATTINNTTFNTYYYSPNEIESAFSAGFETVNTKPIGFFIPPSYLNPFFTKHKLLFNLLHVLDKAVANFSFLANYADHYLIHLKRK